MIPVLFESSATTFTTNGIGRLTDCISCLVTEERNGIFEVEFEYPITGVRYSEIQEGRIIVVSHDEDKDLQPFIIYRRTAPISGVVTFNAHHVSYLLSGIVVKPFTASSVADAFTQLTTKALNTNPFTFWTDNTTNGSLNIEVPTPVRSVLGGTEGSILDVFRGEYDFDNFTVKNYAQRGTDSGVTIRYGKNLTDIKQVVDTDGLYDAVVPFWSDRQSTVVYGGIVAGTGQTATRVTSLDLSNEYEEAPTVSQLETKALSVINARKPWIPKENIKVDFVALWQTEEYKNIAMLERVKLCDTVNIIHENLGVSATAKVITVVWNALLERYDSIELGEAQSSFAQTIAAGVSAQAEDLLANVPTTSSMAAAIEHATELITGGLGGHIVFLYDANGKPTDMLVMDTEDVSTAVHVLRINVNGIGFSSNGVSGTYTSAWTLDGAFVADFITAGTMSANRIHGGTLTLGGSSNGNGVLRAYDGSNNEIALLDRTGLEIYGRDSHFKCIYGNATIRTYYEQISGSGIDSDPPFPIGVDSLVYYNEYETTTRRWRSSLSPYRLQMTRSTRTSSSGSWSSASSAEISLERVVVNNTITSKGVRIDTDSGQALLSGTFTVTGFKSRLVDTDDYGKRYLYCYETPSPMFGDVGEGVIGDDGKCYITIDSIFAETVTARYQVFVQPYGSGDAYVSERKGSYFIVEGTPGLSFGWELKAKQYDLTQYRLEPDLDIPTVTESDLGTAAIDHYINLQEGRIIHD